MKMNRRDFIKSCFAAGITFPAGVFSKPLDAQNNTLVLIELQGGNDGLNTVVPFSDDLYYELRPNLGLKENEIIKLNSQLALHHSLESLMPIWEKGQVQIKLGVGYKSPNLSHFRSIEIWNTASQSDQFVSNGWLAEPLNNQNKLIKGLVLGGNHGPLQGSSNILKIRDVNTFLNQSKLIKHSHQHTTSNPALQHLLKIQKLTDQSALTLKTKLKKINAPVEFEKNNFAQQLKLATQIIQSDLGIPVIKVNLNGFDTHSNQKNKHSKLLKILSNAIHSSQAALESTGHWNQVTMMTYSEFGRRAKENGSMGTDHGTAAPHFIIGGNVQGGFSGKQPSLNDMDGHNLKYTTDFKELFEMAKI